MSARYRLDAHVSAPSRDAATRTAQDALAILDADGIVETWACRPTIGRGSGVFALEVFFRAATRGEAEGLLERVRRMPTAWPVDDLRLRRVGD